MLMGEKLTDKTKRRRKKANTQTQTPNQPHKTSNEKRNKIQPFDHTNLRSAPQLRLEAVIVAGFRSDHCGEE